MGEAAARMSTKSEILEAFSGSVDRPRIPYSYRIGLLVAVAAMIVLPLFYVAITAAAAWLVYLQATDGYYFGRGTLAILLYLTPIVAGAILVFFMVKPLFARPVKFAEPEMLSPEKEPTLFAFVFRICDLVGAPHPKEIRVDHQVNASAGFRRGMLSMFGNDLVLTIGLPLVAGLRADQLAGVLAHEFGHFSQGAGLRLSYIVRTINAWFHRVVYERDEWDAKLQQWSRDLDWRISIMLWFARGGVWLSRKILWGLMMTGHAVSSFLLRQMEFDADLYECRLAGSRTFRETSLEIELLSAASQDSFQQLNQLWQDGKLVDDLAALTTVKRSGMTDDDVDRLREALDAVETGRFDTHPATKDRIAAAMEEHAVGVFRDGSPAETLFEDFETLSKRVTLRFFREDQALDFDDSALLDVIAATQDADRAAASAAALHEMTADLVRLSHPVRLLESNGNTGAAAIDDSQAAAEQLQANSTTWSEGLQQFDVAWSRRSNLYAADGLLRAEFKINPSDFGISESSHEVLDAALRESETDVTAKGEAANPPRQVIERRFAAAQALVATYSGQADIERWGELRLALNALGDASIRCREMQPELVGLDSIYSNAEGLEATEHLMTPIENMSRGLQGKMNSVVSALDGVAYPYSHTQGQLTLQDFVVGGSSQDAYAQAANATSRVGDLYFRVLSELALLARSAERVAQKKSDSLSGAALVNNRYQRPSRNIPIPSA